MAKESSNAHLDSELSEDQRKTIRTYLDAMEISKDYVKPYFEKFVRMARLFNGVCPPELDGTFSKIMLNLAYSMVDTELPNSLRALLGTTDWFTATANAPELEEYAPKTKRWLQYQMEDVQRISATIIPTVQAAHVFGTGYRIYGCRKVQKSRKKRMPSGYAMGIPTGFMDSMDVSERHIISGQDVNIFNVYPLPGGGQVNGFDDALSSCVDGLVWQSYMSKAEILANVEAENWDRRQAERLFDSRSGGDKNDPSQEFKNQITQANIAWNSFSTPSWMDKMRQDSSNLPSRYRVAWFFQRDRWIVVAEDRFPLYDGEPLLPFFPIAKFTSSYNMDEWYGRGIIELVEDLILTIMLLLNHRMDYLAGTLHPTTWVSERVMEFLGGDKTVLDPEPYKTLTFPTNAQVQSEVWRERFPEISQQAFVEDNKLNEWMQMISGQPNYNKGMGGQATLGNETATGIMSLIQQGTARSMMRAANIEESGIRESLALTLRLGSIYGVIQDNWIRTGSTDAFPWEQIPPEAISDDFRISIGGTRSMTAAAETFRKMMQVVQMSMAFPPGIIDNPKEMVRQFIDKAQAFEDIESIVGAGPALLPPMLPQVAQGSTQQAVPGPGDLANQLASVAGASTSTPQAQFNVGGMA